MERISTTLYAIAAAVALSGASGTSIASPGGHPVPGRSELTPPAGAPLPGAEGRVDSSFFPAREGQPAQSMIRIALGDLASVTAYTLWSDDPSTADTTLTQFASVTTDSRGNARLSFNTREGEVTPFGATTLALAGKAIEVRDAAAVVVLSGAFAAPKQPPVRAPELRGRGELLSPPGAPFPGAIGKIESSYRPADDQHPAESSLRAALSHLAPTTTYTIWGDDPSAAGAALTQFASVTTGDHGSAKLSYDTHDGHTLPFGAATTLDLAGQAIEVRDAALVVVLAGEFPPPEQAGGVPTGHGRGALFPPAGAPFSGASGRVDSKFTPSDDHHAAASTLRISLDGLAPSSPYTLWGDDPATPDTALSQFASVTTEMDGRTRLSYDSRQGEVLPFGATTADLGDQSIEVRDASGAVVLAGLFPLPEERPPHAATSHGRGELAPPAGAALPGASGRIESSDFPATKGRPAASMLRITIRRLAPSTAYTAWGDDPATADTAFVQFASITTDPHGAARLSYNSRKGHTLPFGAASTSALAGHAVEVRDGGGAAVLEGAFPDLP